MLGFKKIRIRRNSLGQLEIMDTVKDTYKTIKQMNPVVQQLGKDYEKISPALIFMSERWPVIVLALALVVGAGSAAGSAVVMRRLENTLGRR